MRKSRLCGEWRHQGREGGRGGRACRKPGSSYAPRAEELLRVPEPGNYRPQAQKGWAGRHWRQGQTPEIQVQGSMVAQENGPRKAGALMPSASEKAEGDTVRGRVTMSGHWVTSLNQTHCPP